MAYEDAAGAFAFVHGREAESPAWDPRTDAAVEAAARYGLVSGLGIVGRVLDVGAGHCLGARLLGPACAVTSLDVGWAGLAAARARAGGGAFVGGDAAHLPFAAGVFDAVVAFEVIEHLPRPLAPRLLLEAKRVVRRGGKVIVSTPNDAVVAASGIAVSPYHEYQYSPNEFFALVEACLGDAAYFGLVPHYGFTFNLLREVDVFAVRHRLKAWLGFKTLAELIAETPAAEDENEATALQKQAGRRYRFTRRNLSRSRVLIAVYARA